MYSYPTGSAALPTVVGFRPPPCEKKRKKSRYDYASRYGMPSIAAACCQALLAQHGLGGMERFTAPHVDDTVMMIDEVIATGFTRTSPTLMNVLDRVQRSTHANLDRGMALHVAILLLLMAILTVA